MLVDKQSQEYENRSMDLGTKSGGVLTFIDNTTLRGGYKYFQGV